MIILGIDPGTTAIGYSVADRQKGKIKILQTGLLGVTSPSAEGKLLEIHQGISSLIRRWKVEILAVERLFFAKNQKTALAVAEARGVILLTSALADLKVYEYTPLEVKKTITGDGRADKIQVQKILRLTIPEAKELKARDDVFDAMAVALTYCYKEK